MLTNLICRYELLVLASVVALTTPAAAQTLLIGAPPSRFEEMTPGKIKGIEADFPDMVKEFTGFDAKLARRTSVAETVAKLVDGTDQFAVLQGVEYAWMKEKNPQIEPLLTAIYRTARPKAMLLVLQDNSAKSFADLKGKTLGMLYNCTNVEKNL